MGDASKFQTYKSKHNAITLALTNLYLLVNSNLSLLVRPNLKLRRVKFKFVDGRGR